MNARFALVLPIILLAACDRGEEPARVSMGAGNTAETAVTSEGSSFKIDTEGFKVDIRIPGLAGLTDQMKIDGVRLYPGSKLSGVNIMEAARSGDNLSMSFVAPADAAKVRDWFAKQFAENRFTADASSTGFQGATGDGDRFRLELTATPDGHTFGEFRLARRP